MFFLPLCLNVTNPEAASLPVCLLAFLLCFVCVCVHACVFYFTGTSSPYFQMSFLKDWLFCFA